MGYTVISSNCTVAAVLKRNEMKLLQVALVQHAIHSLVGNRIIAAAVAACLKVVFWCLVAGWLSWHDVHWRF